MADRELKVIISGDPRSLNKAFKSVDSHASKLGSSLKTLGKAAAVGIGAIAVAGVVAGKRMVSLASDAGEVESKFKVIFGKEMPGMIKNLDAFAKATGASRFELREQTADLGALLEPLTASKKAAGDMSVQFVKLATDLGSFNNVPTADALLAIRSGLVGEAEPLRRFGVLLNEANVKQEALRLGLIKGKEELTEQQKVQARASLIMKQTTLAQGDATRTAGSFANQIKALKNGLTDMGTEIGIVLLPHILRFVTFINQNMPTIKAAVEGAVQGILYAFDNFLIPAADRVIAAFRQIAEKAEEYWPRVRTAAQKVADWYKNNLEPTITSVSKNIVQLWDSAGKDTSASTDRNFGKIPPSIKTQMSVTLNVLNAALAVIRGDWNQAWAEISQIPSKLLKGGIAQLRYLNGLIEGAGRALGTAFMDALGNSIVSGYNKVKNWLSGLPGRIRSAVGDLSGVLYSAGYQLIAGFLSGIVAKAQDLYNQVASIPGRVKGIFEHGLRIHSPSEVTIEIGKQVAAGLGVGINIGMVTVEQEAANRIGSVIDKMTQAVADKKGALGAAFSELTSEALSAFDKLESDFETRTEKKIRKQDEQRATKELATRVSEATTARDTAVAGGDPEEIKRAQAELDEALFQQQRAKDEKLAQQEREAHENRQDLRRRHFEEELALLQKNLETGKITQEEAQEKILRLFKKYHIPYKNAGGALGLALAEGIKDSVSDVKKAVKNLVEQIAEALQKIKIVVTVNVHHEGGTLDQRAAGGPVRRGNPYLVGERGPELFIPGQSGAIVPHGATAAAVGGGSTNVFNFPNFVGDQRDLERIMQSVMRRFENSNGVSFTGRPL